MRRRLMLASGVLMAIAGPMAMQRASAAQPGKIVVFAAASLKNALDAVAGKWHAETGRQVIVSYAASSTLAKQIANGAPADLFISADLEWMDYLQKRKLIDPKTNIDLLGNSLVLIAPKNSPVQATIESGFPLVKLLGGGRLAIAEPNSVPAGIYAKAALSALGEWSAVAPHIAAAENVRAALALVARGEAPLGIVYRTDAAVEPAVRIVASFPPDSHPAIIYPVALTVTAQPAAATFEAYLHGPAARAVFEAQGFTVLNNPQ